ncbi:MAG TPA: SMI1/KNR4 family protein [Pirellulales bacterium]
MSALKTLITLMGPPLNPTDVPYEGGWQSVECRLSLKIPEDYKEFVTYYGSGAIDGFLWVLNPFAHHKNVNLISQSAVTLDAQRQFSRETRILETPYPLHPDARGLFPWGVTDNGDVLYWLCDSGRPASEIVVCDGRASRWREYKLATCQFLAALVSRNLVVDIFPEDFPSSPPQFIPLT